MSQVKDAAIPARGHTREHLLRQIEVELGELPQWLEQNRSQLAEGQMLAGCIRIAETELEDRYRLGLELFESGDYAQALGAAVLLSALKPSETRFHFLSGMCMQKLSQIQPAARCFAQALLLDPSHAFAAFRLGECLYGLEQIDRAIELFDLVTDMCRGDEELRPLYLAAEIRACALRQVPE